MKISYSNINSSNENKSNLHVTWFEPDKDIQTVLIISHGIGEYIERYYKLAEFLSNKGIAVVGLDMIGHGKSISTNEPAMYFGKDGSWEYLVLDLINLIKSVKEKYSGIPCYLFGFSMGSFIVRSVMIEAKYKKEDIEGVILAGTGLISNITTNLVKLLIKLEVKKVGGDFKPSKKINDLAFGNYNKYFEPCKTEYDWLCQNESGIKEYMEDKLTQKFITPGMFRELLSGMAYTSQYKNITKSDSNIPIFIISGENDPVSGFSKGIKKIVKFFKKYYKNVKYNKYENSRHDIFHDNCKQKVYNDIYNWITYK